MKNQKIKDRLLNICAYPLILITLIMGTPIGLLVITLIICLVSSLLVIPLVALPVILFITGIVATTIFIGMLWNLSTRYLRSIHYNWLLRLNWRCTHLSTIFLISGACFWIVSCRQIQLTPTENYLCAMIGIILGIISVTLPIIIGNTAKSLAEYQNKLIADIFKNEVTYKALTEIVISLLAIDLVLFFFFHNLDYSNTATLPEDINKVNYIAAFILVSCCYSMYIFIRFIKRFVEYAVNTDVIILEKIDELIKEKSKVDGLSTVYEEYQEVYTQVLQKKGREKSYVGMSDTFSHLSSYVRTIFELNDRYKYTNNLEGVKRYHRFFRKYGYSYFNIWKMIYIDNPDYTINFSDEYEGIVRKALEDPQQREYEPLLIIYQQFAHEITRDIADSVPLAGIIPWQWFLNIVRNDSFDVIKIHLVGSHLFRVMQVIIKKDNDISFNLFISDLINNVWRIIESSNINNLDNKTKEEVIHRAKFLYMPGEYKDLIQQYSSSIYKEDLFYYFKKRFVDNSLSLIVSMIGSYCLFQKKYNLIKIIFEYNQPKYSNTQYINKDISPDDINMLLNWSKDYYLFQGGYFICWDDHHDGSYWLKKYIGLLFYRMCESTKHIHMDVYDKDKNKQELESDKITLDNIKNEVNGFDEDLIKSCGLSIESRVSVLTKFDELIEQISKKIKTKTVNQELDYTKVEKFQTLIKERIKSDTPWANVFQTATLQKNNPETEELKFTITDKQYFEKSFLAEQDSGIYVGFEHTLAEIIILEFAFQLEKKLRISTLLNQMDSTSANNLDKSNFKNKIKTLSADYIVVFINYYQIYDWLSPDNFTSVGKEGPMARIKDGPVIYSLGDRFNPSSRMYLLRKTDFTTVEVKSVNIEVSDLNINNDKLNKIIETQPKWLSNIPKNDQKTYLEQRVEISIKAEYILYSKENPEIQLLVNI